MYHAKEKVIPIASTGDKRLVAMTGEYLPPQLIYNGQTPCCHTKVLFPKEWDVWHSEIYSLVIQGDNEAVYREDYCSLYVSEKRGLEAGENLSNIGNFPLLQWTDLARHFYSS